MVEVIEEATDLSWLSIDEILVSLLSNESIINMNGDSSLENEFKTRVSFSRDKERSILRSRGGDRGRS